MNRDKLDGLLDLARESTILGMDGPAVFMRRVPSKNIDPGSSLILILPRRPPMLVGERMSKPVITVRPEMPMPEALDLMHKEHIRRLPVVNKRGELVGIVTEARPAQGLPVRSHQPEHLRGDLPAQQADHRADHDRRKWSRSRKIPRWKRPPGSWPTTISAACR